jgi:dienelactone hydrolase
MKHVSLAVALVLSGAVCAQAAVKTKTVTYEYEGVKFKGHLAWDDAVKGKTAGVLVVPEWWGLDDHAKNQAQKLAAMGYVALAADMYGEGKLVDHPKEASKLAGAVRSDVKNWVGRAKAGLQVLKDQPNVDATRLAAIGYCFGGSTALQLAHHAADIDAAVSFHGALSAPDADQLKKIKAKILILHGADDTFIPEKTIKEVKAAYDGAKVSYKFIAYPGAVHSFTVPEADKRGLKGIAYNAEADRQSWAEMTALFKSVLKEGK